MPEEQEESQQNEGTGEDGGEEKRNNRRRRRSWLKWLWLLPILLVVGLMIWRWQQPPEVEVVQPQRRAVVQTLTASGRVEGAREVNLSVDRAGILVDVLVREGDRVAAGDVVARISAEVESAELEQAAAAVATARANLDEAIAQAATLAPTVRQAEAEVQGGIVQARERIAAAEARLGELLAGGREQEVREAEAALAQAQARVDQAATEVQRAASLAAADSTARAALDRAIAVARDAEARVQEARARLEQAERDRVRAARLHAEGVIAQAEYEAASTAAATAAETLRQAQAGLAQAQVEVENQRTLLAVTREQELDRARTELEAARQAREQARARLDLVTSPARAEQLAGQQAEIRSARAALQQATDAGPARVESLRRTPTSERVTVAQRRLQEAMAARDAVLARLERTSIPARFSGIVTEVALEPGDVVSPGQAIVVLSEMEWPEIRVEIDERNIAEVSVGYDAYLTADAYPDEIISAVVDRIAPRAITERGILDVILRPADPPPWLRSGMTVDANIIVEDEKNLLVLPTRAVEQVAQEASVLVVRDGEVHRLQVETGVDGVRGTVIRSGLPEDAWVILNPAAVQVGDEVRPVETEFSLEEEADV